MKKLLFLFLLILWGCGGQSDLPPVEYSLSVMEEGSIIYQIAIGIAKNPLEVRVPTQLTITVTLNSGEKFIDQTTYFVDPLTNEAVPILWSVSDATLAFVDGGARLIPVGEGYVTITASLKDKTHSRVVKVNRSEIDSSSVPEGEPPPEDGETEGLPVPPEDTPCQGHAAAVISYTLGAGSGFGVSAMPGIVLGRPQGAGDVHGSTHVLSLGTDGEIILDLGGCHVVDGPGVDMIVFENAFFISGDPTDPYAELGEVGVSEDGLTFFEFPCTATTYPYDGCAGWNPVYSSSASGISSFDVDRAGGDLFDLADIGVLEARYIKIRDLGNTGIGTSVGFDLDAVTVINGVISE